VDYRWQKGSHDEAFEPTGLNFGQFTYFRQAFVVLSVIQASDGQNTTTTSAGALEIISFSWCGWH
jgi:hypothetical protein